MTEGSPPRLGYHEPVVLGRLGRLVGWLCGAVAIAWPGVAFGAPTTPAEPDRVRISFVAPPACPEKASLLAQISERVTIAWLADETELARHIDVVLEPTATGFSGRMEYVDASGRTVTRSLEAPDCNSAMAGIALVTALAIDSQAAQPTPSNAAPRDPERTAPAAAPTHSDAPPSKPTAPVAPKADSSSESVDASNQGPRHEIGAFVGAIQGVGPGLAMGGAIFWGLGSEPFPLLRAVARWYETTEEAASGAGMNAEFRLIAAGPELCLGRLIVGPLAGALCAGAEVGQYVAQGTTRDSDLYVTHTHRMFWAAAELALPLRLAGKTAFVELEPELRFPLVDGTFEFEAPDELVYTIPRTALGLNLAVGVAFR